MGKEESWKYFSCRPQNVLTNVMRDILQRTVFTVVRLGATWAVEHEGETFGHAADKEVARAWAHKRAREIIDRGGAARVQVFGEGLITR